MRISLFLICFIVAISNILCLQYGTKNNNYDEMNTNDLKFNLIARDIQDNVEDKLEMKLKEFGRILKDATEKNSKELKEIVQQIAKLSNFNYIPWDWINFDYSF